MKKKSLLKILVVPAVLLGTLNYMAPKASAELVVVDKENPTIDAKNNLLIDKDPEVKGVTLSGVAIDDKRATVEIDQNEGVDKGNASYIIPADKIKTGDTVVGKYEKVGTYKKEKVNAEITFKNVRYGKAEDISFSDLKITFNKNLYGGFFVSNADDFEINVKFTTQSGEVIDLEEGAFITVNSLNEGEFADRVVPNAELKEYVTNDTLVKHKKVSPIDREVYVGVGKTIPNISESEVPSDSFEDVLGAQTFKRATVSFEVKGKEQDFVIGTKDRKIWFTLNSATLFNVKPEQPKKDVENSDNESIDGGKVKAGQELTYKITQKVNTLGMDLLEKYKSMTFVDKLPDEVTYVDSELHDDKGAKVDEKGTKKLEESTNTLTYNVSTDYLQKEMKYNGETYTLNVKVKVKDDVKDGVVLKNIANVTINNNSQDTNEVTVTPEIEKPVTPVDPPVTPEPKPDPVTPQEPKPVVLPATGGMSMNSKYLVGVVAVVAVVSLSGLVVYLIKKRE